MTLKESIYIKCLDVINEKVLYLQKTISDLCESAANETKSTAGDKHETALAMLQIEQENTARQLREALAQKLMLSKIDIMTKPVQIANGSLVRTNKGYFFLSAAIGKIKINDTICFALSPQSPLGQKLLGLKVNESAEMNGIVYSVKSFE